jgi:hypothetical protein
LSFLFAVFGVLMIVRIWKSRIGKTPTSSSTE